jgi:ribosomal protein S18 acetylase RimI-like enzyme
MTGERESGALLRITVSDDLGNSGAAVVAASLAADIGARFGPKNEAPLSIVAYDGEAVAGGLNGSMHWGWCYIRHLWVEAAWRGRGLGRRLVDEAEVLARGRGCVGLYVDTFDAGAVAFYERAGFGVFGRIDGFPPGFARVFLQKRLAAE